MEHSRTIWGLKQLVLELSASRFRTASSVGDGHPVRLGGEFFQAATPAVWLYPRGSIRTFRASCLHIGFILSMAGADPNDLDGEERSEIETV